MTDRELLVELLALDVTDRERLAFDGMLEWLDDTDKRLTKKQREWVRACGVAHNLIADESLNLHSAGLVPDGLKVPSSRGGEIAKQVLQSGQVRDEHGNLLLRPPGVSR